MRLTLTVALPASGQRTSVVVEAGRATTVGEVAGELAALDGRAGHPPGPAAVFVDGQPVDPRLPLAGSPIREGCVVSIGDPSGCLPPEPAGIVEIRVAGGPAAGAVHRLASGHATIGRGPPAAVAVADPTLPGAALGVDVDGGGQVRLTVPGGVMALLDREVITGTVAWPPGAQLAIGASLLDLAAAEPPDATLQISPDGAGLGFSRPPRLLPPPRPTRFRLPAPPGRRSARSHTRRDAGYAQQRARVEQDARDALDAERARLRTACPDPATVLTIATRPRQRLWERRRGDPDYLLLRVGTSYLPSAVVLEDPAPDGHRREVAFLIPDAPVTVPLAERGVLGVAGPGGVPRAIGRWLVGQAVTLHSPCDLRLCVLTDGSAEHEWDWVRWLPHARPAEGQNAHVLIGNDAETVAARVAELAALVASRRQASHGAVGEVRFAQADTLVVLDGARRLCSLPGVITLLREGPLVGVRALCLDARERLLPAQCQAVVAARPDGLRVEQAGDLTVGGVRPDQVGAGWAARLARGLAPIRDTGGEEAAGVPESARLLGVPESARLLDVLRLEPPAPGPILTRWLGGGQATAAVVGESADGPFGIDLRRDGPHALVAGTAGSGKSELLQTIIASLAVANRPDAMTFVLIDYQGGSAFGDCVRLPHTVGMMTDLDAHLAGRALTSLTAELTRREDILAVAGATDIDDYLAGRVLGVAASLPRLVLAVDEFAALARDLPDFVTGLVNIAQRGRPLGLHLILATQRPSVMVSADIRASTNLRIALRATDPAESARVIDAPDAALIPPHLPGRGYARVGTAPPVPFQTARVGGRRPVTPHAAGLAGPAERPWLARLDWAGLGRPPLTRPPGRPADGEITDLGALVEAIGRASERLGLAPPHRPWLDPLRPGVLLADLAALAQPGPAAPPEAGAGLPPVPYGLDDLPAEQAQRVCSITFATFGHLLVAGAARSGRSQLLRTIAGSIAHTISCADAHLYGIDCGNGALLPLTSLPHCGAVVTRTQTERAARLLNRLVGEVARRQELLASGGFAGICEQRAAGGERLPHIVVLIDRWEGFLTSLGEVADGTLIDQVHRLAAEGRTVGVHLIVVGDRRLLSGRLGAMVEDKLSFRLADRAGFSLIGVNPGAVPGGMPPGRALRAGSGVETQVALLAADVSGQGQAAALAAIGAAAARRDAGVPAGRRPFRVDVLPHRVTFAEAWRVRDPACAGSPLFGLVGVGGDELTGYGPDLSQGVPAFVIAGPRRSGRSTALVAMTRSLLAAGARIVLVTPRPSPLRRLAGQAGVAASFDSRGPDAGALAAALAAVSGPAVVVVDDAELLSECAAGDELSQLVSFGAERQRALVLAGAASEIGAGSGNWQAEARKAGRGCLLSPREITDADLIGARVPGDLIGGPVTPGRGLLHLGDGVLRVVQVPSG
jgi:DNA segregation ATPase FtsK/SpoIIIE, S-DNA-T family